MKELMKLTLEPKMDDVIATIMALDREIRCGNSNTESAKYK